MLKRIYAVLFSSALISLQSLYAAPASASNIKKIIKKDGKVIVIVRENGKDKEIILDQNMLNKITSKKADKSKKSSKKTKIVKKDKKSSKKAQKKSIASRKKSPKKVKVSKGNKKPQLYTVKSGDTIFSIARKYKVSITALSKLNNLSSSKLIHPGDVIKIPKEGYLESATKAVKNNKKRIYLVKKGDTLSLIAKKFSMKIEDLRRLNNFKPNPKLKPGMEVNVIGKMKTLKPTKSATKYVVKRGDTVWSIAKRHGITVAQLRLLNPKIRVRGLRKGAVLRVSKSEAARLAKLSKKRKSRLSGLLKKYQQRGSRGSKNVVAYAKRFLGVRYRWGATGRGGFDCSGFTQYVMRHAKGRAIPRVSRRQAYYGRYVSRRNLRAGDLIFFDTSRRRRGYVNHVGIYIGNGRFIHASSGKHRVVITSLNKPFYRSRFMWGRRIN